MKNLFILLFLALSFSVTAQTIRRCNNDPNVPTSATVFRSLQEAHDAASNGDIIYVEPSYFNSSNGSTYSYGNLTCAKTLKIIGNGYDHDQNTGTYQNWDHMASIVGNITIEAGAGTVLQGLKIGTGITIKAQNVVVTRCYLYGSLELERSSVSQNASGAVISHNFGNFYIRTKGYYVHVPATCSYTAYPVQNVTIKNNAKIEFLGNFNVYPDLYTGGNCTVGPTQIPAASNITLVNNVFSQIYYDAGIRHCKDCIVHSNIFIQTPNTGILNNCPGTTASYNVCGTNPCGYGTNNVDAATESILFTGGANPPYDKDYQLTSFSPAKAAGLGGVDAGAFGTNDPYRLSGLAPIPQITSYSKNASSGIYTTSTPMTITISVKGNN